MDDNDRLDAIVARAKQRDPAALDALVDRYSDRVFGLLYRMTRSRHEAEDLLQEVFLRLVRTLDRYQHQGRFEAWLMRIAVNLGRDHIRRNRRQGKVLASTGQDSDATDPLDAQPGNTPAPDAPAALAEQVDQLSAALTQLSDGEREVIMLRHYSDMSFKEIAEAMGIPLGTALARGHRGLAKLRSIMEAEV